MTMEVAGTLFARLKGLIGREGFAGTLLLVPCNDIHTFGMKRPIDVAFVSEDGLVIEVCRRVAPNRRLRNRDALATLERFSVDEPWFELGDKVEHGGFSAGEASKRDWKEVLAG